MPELPEVETVRRALAGRVEANRIVSIEIADPRLVVRSVLPPADVLAGAEVSALERRGKWLFAPLDTGDEWVIHLRMSGRLLAGPPFSDSGVPRGVARFADGLELRFVDRRRFGEWLVMPTEAARELRGRIGPDADTLTTSQLRRALDGRTGRLKGLITNQSLIGGIGNMYADEALWRAGLDGKRSGGSLTAAETRSLATSIRTVMARALKAGGTTTRDGLYAKADGTPGYFAVDLEVYQREGEPCSRCGTEIRRTKQGATSTYHCPACQQ